MPLVLPSRGLCPLSFFYDLWCLLFISGIWLALMCNLQPFFPFLVRFFQAHFHTVTCTLPVLQYSASSCPGGVRRVPSFSQALAFVCSLSFSPLRVGEQSGVPSVGCTPIQRTKDDLGIFGFSALWLFPMQLATTPFTTHLSSSLLAFGFLCISS